MYKCLARMCMHGLQRAESTGSLWTGVIDGCKPPYRCWESNFNPLEEQPVFLTYLSSPLGCAFFLFKKDI